MRPEQKYADTPKRFLRRWVEEDSAMEVRIKVDLVRALEGQGFERVSLRVQPYEEVHKLWRFTFGIGPVPHSEKIILHRIKEACAAVGVTFEKECSAVLVEGGRARGALRLGCHTDFKIKGLSKEI